MSVTKQQQVFCPSTGATQLALEMLTLQVSPEEDKETRLKTKEWPQAHTLSQSPLNLPGTFPGTSGHWDKETRGCDLGQENTGSCRPSSSAPFSANEDPVPSLLEQKGGKSDTLLASHGREDASWKARGKMSFLLS